MAYRGKHRTASNSRSYRRAGGFTTIVGVLVLLTGLLPQAPLSAAAQQEDFYHWLNDSGKWAKGAINAQNSSYPEGDVIPHWIEWKNVTVGQQVTFSFSYEWQDAAGNTGHDYLDDVNQTESAPLVGGLSTIAIPADPDVTGQLGAQPAGQFSYKGFTVDSVKLDRFDHGDREDKYYTFTVTFTESTGHLYYGAHLAKDADWPAGGASSFSGGNLENRFDRDGIGLGSSADQTLSIQVGAITEEPLAAVDIEKSTNGQDADTAPGPELAVGIPVTWTYRVTNTGNTELTGITVTDDQGVTVTCGQTTLAVADTMTCTATGTATQGQYTNLGTVTTTQGATDTDRSHYLGIVPDAPAVDIEKSTNGQDADTAPGPELAVGIPVTWTYRVTNTGNTELTGITVTDDQGVTVTCGQTTLAVADTMTCTATGTATQGQYTNLGTVTTTQGATDTDRSHYLGIVPDAPAVDIEKSTNGQDADTAPGPELAVGIPVTWTYRVTNTGNTELTGITVTDDQGVTVTCGQTTLAVADTMTCTATGTATQGQYTNLGTVTTTQGATDTDASHYLGIATPVTTPPTGPSPGSIGDFVWNDGLITAANGIQDPGEPGVSGVTVNLYDGSGTTKLATRNTGNDGKYLFTGLAAGTYIVEFIPPDGSAYSFGRGNPGGPDLTDSDADPTSGRTAVITLSSGQNDTSWDAGLVTAQVLPQVITAPTTTTASTPPETLPFTGSRDAGAAGVGMALVILGSTVLLVVRRKEDEPEDV